MKQIYDQGTTRSKRLTESSNHCAGRIAASASHLKLKPLSNEYSDLAIGVACPTSSNGSLYNPSDSFSYSSPETQNAIWYTTVRKKALPNTTNETHYVISPTT